MDSVLNCIIYISCLPGAATLNVITVDVEDWFHVCGLNHDIVILPEKYRVEHYTGLILDMLAEFSAKATFFILGSVAELFPGLAPRIAGSGHEIASHGWSHTLVDQLDDSDFREEIRRTSRILEWQTGQRPVGFRAPQWSMSLQRPSTYDILAEEGYIYDSSLNPIPFIGDIHGSRKPFPVNTFGGATVLEIPPLVADFAGMRLPAGGGWGFRVLPMRMIRRSADALNEEGAPAVFYIHPRELDPSGPRLSLSPLKSFAAYGPRTGAEPRIREILGSYRFKTMVEVAAAWQSAS